MLRSDAVEIDESGCMQLAPECGGVAPVVLLDAKCYRQVDSLAALGVPSLKHCRRLVVRGPHHFAGGESLCGEVEIG